MFLIDTDHLGIIQRETQPQYSRLLSRIQEHPPNEFFVAIISFHEQVSGWNSYINRARTPTAVVRAYAMLHQILTDFVRMSVVQVDNAAAAEFDAL